jgi:outer membrane receptor protein involved in Fe transport
MSGTPLDIWQPSSSNIKPQRADQISIGYFKNLPESNLEFSTEAYYKDLKNQIDYKDGADLILKSFFESELVFGKGWAYGLEFLLRKNSGDLTGWISYSFSTSKRQFDEINGGRAFNAKNDKTHELNIVTQYQVSPKWVFSANWVFSSGFTTTVPYGRYYIDGKKYLAYTDRNGFRLPAYHRLDIGFSYTNNLGGTWNFSFYNAYNRKNIYAVLFRDKSNSSGKMEAVKLSLFGIIPSISYTLRF